MRPDFFRSFFIAFIAIVAVTISSAVFSQSQVFPAEQVQIAPPGHTEPPSVNKTPEQLEQTADVLRARKSYLDAIDYYQAALAKGSNKSRLFNKIGIVELELQRYREAARNFTHAIHENNKSADGHNNLGVVDYLEKKNNKALKEYKKAIQLNGTCASFYSNIAAVYFSRKEFTAAAESYAKAMQLDPDIFEHTSVNGVSGRISSPQDRAHYDYVLAGLYARMGNNSKSLEYLRRALEEGYKDVQDVYKDPEFASLRNDARFVQLMASKPPPIAN